MSGKGLIDDGRHLLDDFGPNLEKRLPQSGGMAGAKNGYIGVVTGQAAVRADHHEHREGRFRDRVDNASYARTLLREEELQILIGFELLAQQSLQKLPHSMLLRTVDAVSV